MITLPEVGDIATLKSYCHNNKYGGTATVKDTIMVCKITKAWYDDECGWRYHAIPLNGEHDVIYVSEFDIVDVKED